MHKALMLMNKLISKIRNLKPLATSASIILEVDEIRKQVIDLTEVEIERIETEDMQRKQDKNSNKTIFSKLTRKNLTKMEYWDEWSEYYEERKDIPEGTYRNLMKEIDSTTATTCQNFYESINNDKLGWSSLKSMLQQLQIVVATNLSILIVRPVFLTPKSTIVLMHLINTIHDLGKTIEQA
ncbi:12028_t:CDS:2, partial [Gigaspora margarita]